MIYKRFYSSIMVVFVMLISGTGLTQALTPSPTPDALIALEIYRTPNWLQLYVPVIPEGYFIDLSSLEFKSTDESYPMSDYTAFASRLSTITSPTCFGIYIDGELRVEDWEKLCESLDTNQRFADNDLGLGDKFWQDGEQFTTFDIYLHSGLLDSCSSGSFGGEAFECKFFIVSHMFTPAPTYTPSLTPTITLTPSLTPTITLTATPDPNLFCHPTLTFCIQKRQITETQFYEFSSNQIVSTEDSHCPGKFAYRVATGLTIWTQEAFDNFILMPQCIPEGTANLPRRKVNAYEAEAYCNYLNLTTSIPWRLPTYVELQNSQGNIEFDVNHLEWTSDRLDDQPLKHIVYGGGSPVAHLSSNKAIEAGFRCVYTID